MTVLEHLAAMSPERFLAIYSGLEIQGFGPLDKEVALALRFRPQAVKKLPMAQRAKRARLILEAGKSTELAYEVFGAYLIRHRKELVTGFLDATGVEHQDGMIEDIEKSKPDPTRLGAAVQALDGQFPPEDVTLYLALAAEQWPGVTQLADLVRERTR
ncbi:MAG: hypothetical protein JNK02_06100 [Planctomycetes bacterium]|nr:hypothetical protein [Planctomycetota bacterium]